MSTRLSQAEIDAALELCAQEPVHIPGVIQPNGTLLACHPGDGRIITAAVNTAEVLGVPMVRCLGQRLADVLGEPLWQAVCAAAAKDGFKSQRMAVSKLERDGATFDVSGFESDGLWVIEIEADVERSLPANMFQSDILDMITHIQNAEYEDDLMHSVVSLLRDVTGYDRVMAYRFDADFNGEVVAEDARDGLDTYLGLRFPKWDIPKQARALMLKFPLRFIGDVDQTPVPLMSVPDHPAPLDISLALLRGVSPIHLEYLRNMKVAATMTLSVRLSGRLWGLIALHHYSPRVPALAVRLLANAVLPFIEARLALSLRNREIALLSEIEALRHRISTGFGTDADLEQVFEDIAPPILSALGADGMMLSTGQGDYTAGRTVPPHVHAAVCAAVRANRGEIFSTDCLLEQFRDVSKGETDLCGVLGTVLAGDACLVLYRTGIRRQVNWAGSPEKDIRMVDNSLQLSPRGSFGVYVQTIENRAVPWSQSALQTFGGLALTLGNATERQILFEAKQRQQALMTGELNHRVRNILALVQSVSRRARFSHVTIDAYQEALDKRIQALAQAHNLADDPSTDALSLRRMLELEAEPHVGGNTDRVRLSGDDAFVRAHDVPILALVLHELFTNAVKYGALRSDNGNIDVTLLRGVGLSMTWRETGGPIVSTPERDGFGSSLIRQALPFDLGGSVEIDYAPDGMIAKLWLPESVFDATRTELPVQVANETIPSPSTGISDLWGNETVLLVEDNFMIAVDTADTLRSNGLIDVDIARDCADAFEILDTCEVGFAVLDVNLGPSGEQSFEIADRLRRDGVPFVFATGYGESIQLLPRFAGTAVLTKPVTEKALMQAVRRLLEQRVSNR